MAPKEPRDRERQPEAGLFLVSDKAPPQEWESYPRYAQKPARDRLGPIRSSRTRAERSSRTESEK